MGFIQGEARGQQTLFPVTLDDLVPSDHVCRVIEAFVGKLDMAKLGFERAEPAETGRPGYDPRDLLKLYLYGYLQQVRSSRRLEAECQRNVEHAVAAIHGGTPIRDPQVPHLRTSALPAARSRRCTDRDQPGDHGLQPETNDERARWPETRSRTGTLSIRSLVLRPNSYA